MCYEIFFFNLLFYDLLSLICNPLLKSHAITEAHIIMHVHTGRFFTLQVIVMGCKKSLLKNTLWSFTSESVPSKKTYVCFGLLAWFKYQTLYNLALTKNII